MKKSTKKAIVIIISIIAVIVIIGVAVIGISTYKNRWHKLNFKVENITVGENNSNNSDSDYKYTVVIEGTARAWFYDFKTYEFHLAAGSGGDIFPKNVKTSGRMTVNSAKDTPFKITFETDDISEIQSYIFTAFNIIIDGESENSDIRLYMNDYQDLLNDIEQ